LHRAGQPADGVQRCTTCGGILIDGRNAMAPEGSGPLRTYDEGAWVLVYELGSLRLDETSQAGRDAIAEHPKCEGVARA
jgi:hypothetical protein